MTDINHDEIVRKLRSLQNRGDEHIFLGHPLSAGCDKTTVEIGNTYSPGVWTCGVAVVIIQDNKIFTPDLLDRSQIEWHFETEPSFKPVLEAKYQVGPIKVIHRLCSQGGEGSKGIDLNEISLTSENEEKILFGVLIKDIGPAGGKINSLNWDEELQTLSINNSIDLKAEFKIEKCNIYPIDENFDSPMAICWRSEKISSRPTVLRFQTDHTYNANYLISCIPKTNQSTDISSAIQNLKQGWEKEVPSQVYCPDQRLMTAWNACAYHLFAAMECGHPRIGAVNYPVFWMRDCVIVLRALDFLGRHDLSHIGNEYLSNLLFSGGFGAESDAPGQAIWALFSHAEITNNLAWLEAIFPSIIKRIAIIDNMRTTQKTLYALAENRTLTSHNNPASTILAYPASNGLIHGRMDWHSPDFFINCWAYAGYTAASKAAKLLNKLALAEKWSSQANDLDSRISEYLLPKYGNPRDPIITPYPSNALASKTETLRTHFIKWYKQNRIDSSLNRIPENLWTYFEIAQIHNAFLLGYKEEAWINLNGMLNDSPNCVFIEGEPFHNEELPFGNCIGKRGWLQKGNSRGGNMPHNWTSAEMITCIRDMFVHEDENKIIIGKGIPDSWKKEGLKFGVKNMPTSLGTITFEVTFKDAKHYEMVYNSDIPYACDF